MSLAGRGRRSVRQEFVEDDLMRVEFLGTGGYHPNERRHTPCVMLPELGIVLDAGTAFFRVPSRLATPELHIFLSHAHLDHIVGLTYILVAMAQGKLKRACVHATEETLAAVRQHLFASPIFTVIPAYEGRPLESPVEVPGRGVLRHIPLRHPGGSNGFRIDWPGRSLAFVAEPSVDVPYTNFVRGASLLIHECYAPDAMGDLMSTLGHSHTSAVAQLARDAGVGKLVLMHVDPQLDQDDPIDLC